MSNTVVLLLLGAIVALILMLVAGNSYLERCAAKTARAPSQEPGKHRHKKKHKHGGTRDSRKSGHLATHAAAASSAAVVAGQGLGDAGQEDEFDETWAALEDGHTTYDLEHAIGLGGFDSDHDQW